MPLKNIFNGFIKSSAGHFIFTCFKILSESRFQN